MRRSKNHQIQIFLRSRSRFEIFCRPNELHKGGDLLLEIKRSNNAWGTRGREGVDG